MNFFILSKVLLKFKKRVKTGRICLFLFMTSIEKTQHHSAAVQISICHIPPVLLWRREKLGMGKYGVTESQRGNWNVPGRLTGSPGNGKDRRKGILVTPASKKNYFPISNIDKPESYLRAQIKSQVEF